MNIRYLAAKQLAEVIGQKRSLSAVSSELPDLSPSDHAWIHAAVYGVLRQYYFLSACLAKLMKKPLKEKEAEVQALLLLGIYQLQFMRVPAHAAISETVAAVKTLRKPWAVGLVNAVLRQFQRSGEAIIKGFPKQMQYAHVPWLYQSIKQDWPQHYAAILKQNLQQPPIHLRVNTQKISRAAYQGKLTEAQIQSETSTLSPIAITLVTQTEVEALPGFVEGMVSVQDIAAQQAVPLLAAQSGMRVLDACSAPGGKLSHLLEAVPDVEVVALEQSADRMVRVEENLQRLGLSAQLVQGDAAQTDWWTGQLFDCILLDAPCSATGVIRRHPDIQILRCATDILALSEMQYKILQNLWTLLAPGGVLLYATCSVLKQENDQVVEKFLAKHDDAQCSEIALQGGVKTDYGYQFLPTEKGPDGFYYSRLTKN